jgi:hypothetical protein
LRCWKYWSPGVSRFLGRCCCTSRVPIVQQRILIGAEPTTPKKT